MARGSSRPIRIREMSQQQFVEAGRTLMKDGVASVLELDQPGVGDEVVQALVLGRFDQAIERGLDHHRRHVGQGVEAARGAVAEDGGMARPLATVGRGAAAMDDVRAVLATLPAPPDEVVIGLPLEASGVEGPQARATRAWAEAAEPAFGMPLQFRDERLSSYLAEQRLGAMKRGRSGGPPTPTQRRAYRERVDREAAAIILQDELDARARPAT